MVPLPGQRCVYDPWLKVTTMVWQVERSQPLLLLRLCRWSVTNVNLAQSRQMQLTWAVVAYSGLRSIVVDKAASSTHYDTSPSVIPCLNNFNYITAVDILFHSKSYSKLETSHISSSTRLSCKWHSSTKQDFYYKTRPILLGVLLNTRFSTCGNSNIQGCLTAQND